MATSKYIFTVSNGQLLVELNNVSLDFDGDESKTYKSPTLDLFKDTIVLLDFGVFVKPFKIENIETINLVVPTDIKNAFDLLLALLPNEDSIPDASETVAGKVSVGTQTFGGNKTIVGESATVGNALTVQNLAHSPLFSVQNGKGVTIQSVGNNNGDKYITFGDSSGIQNREVYFERVSTSGGGLRIRTGVGTAFTIDGMVVNFGASVGLAGGANLFTGQISQGDSSYNFVTRSVVTNSVYKFYAGRQTANPSLLTDLMYQIDTNTITPANRQYSFMIPIKVGNTTLNHTSALVDFESTTKGFAPPRMTTGQKNAIVTPMAGLMVFDTTLMKLCIFTTVWETITSI